MGLIRRIFVLATVALALVLPGAAQARRVALVIGNAHYLVGGTLPGAANDALLIAGALGQAGFEVVPAPDLDWRAFNAALGQFRARAAGAEIAIIYYAGHGIERQGKNYLVPTDANLGDPYDLGSQAIDLDRVTEATEGAQLRIMILDACRDNPFGRGWPAIGRSVTRGLAQVSIDDVMVIYAAAPGQVANDKVPGVPGGDKDSPFALSLARRLLQPGLPAQLLGGVVRDDVVRTTQNLPPPYVRGQRPFVVASVTGEPIYLVAPVVQPLVGQVAGAPQTGNPNTLSADELYRQGVALVYGMGVPQDYAKARQFFEQAAAKGSSRALNSLGVLYTDGQGVQKDYVKARQLFEQAAAEGDSGAMNNLGSLYALGTGVAQDDVKARQWYEQSAAKGDSDAMRELGNIYATGQGVPRDDAKARQWYEQSAAKGSTAAMMALGRLYEEGQGVAVDLAKAREWVQKAADLRFPPAKSWLADHPK